MSTTTRELDLWIKSNWPKKFDRRSGKGNPNTNNVVGHNIFDFYQDITDGQVYTWTISIENYQGDPNYVGDVSTVSDLESLFPIEEDQFVIVTNSFSVAPFNFKIGQIITAKNTLNVLENLRGNIALSFADATWSEVGSGGDSGGITYTNMNPVTQDVGGVYEGTTFNNATLSEVFDMLFYPYQMPSFSSFSITGIPTFTAIGSEIVADDRNVSWTIDNDENLSPNSISVTDITNNNIIDDGLSTSPTSLGFPSYSYNVPTTLTFELKGSNTNNAEFSRQLSVKWVSPIFYGESSDNNLTDINTLREELLSDNISGDYSFEEGGYKYLAFPTDGPQPSSIKDKSTNLDVSKQSPYQTTVSINGVNVDYTVYRTTNILGGSIVMIVE